MNKLTFALLIGIASVFGSCQIADAAKVTLTSRAEQAYGKSAYSFRYRSQSLATHKNYVDVVYQNDMIAINHHGGLVSRIADLGEVELAARPDGSKIKQWQDKQIKPQPDHCYLVQIKADKNQLSVAFKVISVEEDSLSFEWLPAKTKRWPVSLRNRGRAGESGFRPRTSSSNPRSTSSN